jgi:hypothetical protein
VGRSGMACGWSWGRRVGGIRAAPAWSSGRPEAASLVASHLCLDRHPSASPVALDLGKGPVSFVAGCSLTGKCSRQAAFKHLGMIEISQRPFTADERAQVERLLTRNVSRSSGLVGAIAAFLVAALLALLVIAFFPALVDWGGRVALAAGALAGIWMYTRTQSNDRRVAAAAIYRSELAGGMAEVSRYRAVDAIAVAEAEDEGLTYFLQLESGEVLFVSGQYLYEFEGTAFPSTIFEATRTPASRVLLGFRPLGQYLKPSTERPPFRAGAWEQFGTLEDGALLDLPFDSLRADAA